MLPFSAPYLLQTRLSAWLLRGTCLQMRRGLPSFVCADSRSWRTFPVASPGDPLAPCWLVPKHSTFSTSDRKLLNLPVIAKLEEVTTRLQVLLFAIDAKIALRAKNHQHLMFSIIVPCGLPLLAFFARVKTENFRSKFLG